MVLDARVTGLCGSAERVAMDCLAPFPRARAADLCHQVLMRILPGAMEADFAPFAEGISTVQSLNGDYFAPAQGGSMYTSAAVARLLEWNGTVVTNYYESDGLISNDAWCIETDVNGNVWIGTIEGTCIFDGQGFTNFNLPEGKIDTTAGVSSTKMIHSILEDSKGTIWFCTNAGLISYTNKRLKNISDEVGIQTNFVNKIVEDKKVNSGFRLQ